jgi:post-segregation antitoxin (ccd killing protein)
MRIYRFGTRTARRVPVNSSISPDLVVAAKARRINLSCLVEQRLVGILQAETTDPFFEENRDAVAAYNRRVEAFGVFSDAHRSF